MLGGGSPPDKENLGEEEKTTGLRKTMLKAACAFSVLCICFWLIEPQP